MQPSRRSPPPVSNSDDNNDGIPGECPTCKSTNVAIIVNPKSCKLIQFMGHVMVHCRDCGHQSPAHYVKSLAAIRLRNPAVVVSEDLVCPTCRNSIRGQQIASPCAGCGAMIPEHMAMSRKGERKKSELSIWSYVGILVVVAGAYGAYRNAQSSRGVGIVLLLVAGYFFYIGIRGFLTGQTKLTDKWLATTYTGWKAKVISILHIMFGVAVLVAGILLIQWNSPIASK